MPASVTLFDDDSWPETLAIALRLLAKRRPVQLVCPPWLEATFVGDILDLGRSWSRALVDGYPTEASWKQTASEFEVSYYPTGGKLADGRTWTLKDVLARLRRAGRPDIVVLRGDQAAAAGEIRTLVETAALVYVGITPLGEDWDERPHRFEYDPPPLAPAPLGNRSRPSGLSH